MDEKDLEKMTPEEYVAYGSQPQDYTNAAIPEEKKPVGLGVAALVLGILSILLVCIPVVPLLTALFGIILGGVGIKKASKGKAGGKGMAIAGLVMSIVCMVLGLVSTFFLGGAILVPSMLGYTKKSNLSAMNTNAKYAFDAANTALIELDSMGYDLPYDAVISSDSSLQYGVDSSYAYEFEETMLKYFGDLENYDYFVVIRYGSVSTAVCSNGNYCGRYPSAILIDDDSDMYDLYYDALYY